MQIKPQYNTITHLPVELYLKRLSVPNIAKDVEQLKLSYTGGVWVNLEKIFGIFY